jgi:hypothetical protein
LVPSPAGVSLVLKEEGFARLPRRRDEGRPATIRPQVAAVTDVRELDLRPRTFGTQFGGIFLFVPYLSTVPLQRLLDEAGLPGTGMIPAAHAMRSLLALKLFGNARHSGIMSHVLNEGLGLFAGLNVIPKRAFLTEYSCRLPAECHQSFKCSWFLSRSLALLPGHSRVARWTEVAPMPGPWATCPAPRRGGCGGCRGASSGA